MKRPISGNNAELETLKTYLKLIRATEKVTTASHRHLAETSLTASQFSVLEMIYHLGPLNQRAVAKKTGKSHGNITVVITNLEKRNLVKRRKQRADRRHHSIELTEDGETLVERIFPRHVAGIVKSFNPLTAAEQHELARLCHKLGTNQEDSSISN